MKNKRILMSLAMLLVSAIMLSSASYAWFSMNTDVSVEGIEFVAYSDSLFLEISKDNKTFAPNDISAELAKKYLRPIAYGTIEDMGGAYTIEATKVPKGTRFANEAADELYYTTITKADTNDTGYGEVDYICVNEELRKPSSTSGMYILGRDINFVVITDDNYSETLYEKIGNNYVVHKLEKGESTYGYYYADVKSPCAEDEVYSPGNQYYQLDDKTGNYYLASGLDEGSHLDHLYTLDVKKADTYANGGLYYLKSVGAENDQYPDYIAFKANKAPDDSKKHPENGYWYRGYSESLVTVPGQADPQVGRINGVIVDNDTYTDQNNPYYLHTTYYLRMGEASALAENLRVNSVEVIGSELPNSMTSAVRVMFVVSSSTQPETVRVIYNNADKSFTRDDGTGRHFDSGLFYERFLGDRAEIVTVQVYLYYDGTEAIVNSNTDLDFSGHSVNIEFAIDVPDYLK